MKKTIPAVSIIIPMYNTEKYIGECLDSILAQTFQDFEVIVVDDCSTDNSCAIVENYLSTFNRGGVDKLKLIRSEKNSGGCPGIPRNTGIRLAVGEYIMFVDSDDAITSTALEELYPIAKKFDADVVYCEKYYRVEVGEQFTTDKKFLNVAVGWTSNYDFVTKPMLTSEDIAERVKDFGTKKFWTACWNYLFKRNLIMQNNIFFPDMKIGEDEIFDFEIICTAKKLVRVPNIIYAWRRHMDAVSVKPLAINPHKTIESWASSTLIGIGLLDEFMNGIEFFRNYTEYKYLIFESFISGKLRDISTLFEKIPAHQLDALIRNELKKVKEQTALTAFLFSRMNVFHVRLNQQGAIIQQMNAYIQQQNQVIQQLQARINELQK